MTWRIGTYSFDFTYRGGFCQRLLMALLLVAVVSQPLRAQFYAPETVFHDPVQRLFPVEAARVAAVVAGAAPTTQIRWKLETSRGGETRWDIEWLDSSGGKLQAVTVAYEEKELTSGADWLRRVWGQVMRPWKRPPATVSDGEKILRERFWAGLDASADQVTRLERVNAAADLAKEHPPEAQLAHAAELAGRLCHAGQLSLVTPLTLDALLQARAAAWLAHAESQCSSKVGECWAPLLYLAGRVPQARLAAQSGGELPSLEGLKGWKLALRKNTVREWFTLIATPGNEREALPFVAEASHIQASSLWPRIWAECLPEPLRARLHDYLLHMSEITMDECAKLITPARILEGRRELVSALRRHAPSAEVEAAQVALAGAKKGEAQLSLGLQELAPILKRGFDASPRPLRPVSVVTGEDLVMHAWEDETCRLLAKMANIRQLQPRSPHTAAQKLIESLGGHLPDFATHGMAYMGRESGAPKVPEPENGLRTAFIGSSSLSYYSFPVLNPKLTHENDPAADELFVYRPWLMRNGMTGRMLYAYIWMLEPEMSLRELADRILDEGGEEQVSELYLFLSGKTKLGGRLLADEAWMARLDAAAPQAVHARRALAAKPWMPGWHSLPVALALEREFWQAPDSSDGSYLFWRYIEAGAIDAAKRFYTQARALRDIGVDEADFASLMAPSRWTLAWLENDREGMQAALADSRGDATLAAYHAIITGDDATAMAVIEKGMVDEAEAGKPLKEQHWTRLRTMLREAPALAKAGSPEYTAALGMAKQDTVWIEVPYLLQQRYKLPVDDAAKLIGEPNPGTHEQWAFINYLRGNRSMFDEKFRLCVGSSARRPFWRVMLPWLYRQMHGLKPLPPEKQPDLRPADAAEPLSAILRRLRGKQ